MPKIPFNVKNNPMSKSKLDLLYEIAEKKSLELEEYTNVAKDVKQELDTVLAKIKEEQEKNQPKFYVGKIYKRKGQKSLLTILYIENQLRIFNLTHQQFWNSIVKTSCGFDINKPLSYACMKSLSKHVNLDEFVEIKFTPINTNQEYVAKQF